MSAQKNAKPVESQVPPVVTELLELLGGQTVLIGWSPGVKGEKRRWKSITQQHMTPDYLARLQGANIGVSLGKISNGLCSIDIDRDEEVEPFLEVNPRLRATLRTRGARGCNLWVRIIGDYPGLSNLQREGQKYGEWRADGGQTIVHGLHPSGVEYQRVVSAKPVEIRFEEIQWPVGVRGDFMTGGEATGDEVEQLKVQQELEERYGEPLHLTKSKEGGLTITGVNQRYWGAVMCLESRILHEPEERAFFLYNPQNGLWEKVTAERLGELVSERLMGYARQLKRGQRRQLEKLIGQMRIKAVVEMMRGMAERRDAFVNRPRIVHVANGAIRFGTGGAMLEGFSPEHYSRNQSPVLYEAAAECPRFMKELLQPAISGEDIELLQRWFGVALFGENLPQRIMLLDGTAGGGKSTVVAVLEKVLGETNCYQLRTDCLANQFELFRFRGKTVLAGVDVPGDFLEQRGAAILKALVGGDRLSPEQKGGNGDFSLVGNLNVIITSNSRLRARLDGDVEAWRRRLMIVRYSRPPVGKRVLGFAKQLVQEEGAGILRWGLAGLEQALREFDETGDFLLTENQRARVDGLLAESDSVRCFLRERVERSGVGQDVTSSELTVAYAEYCTDKGWSPLPPTVITRQYDELMLEMFHVVRANSIQREGKSARGWRGVQLKGEGL